MVVKRKKTPGLLEKLDRSLNIEKNSKLPKPEGIKCNLWDTLKYQLICRKEKHYPVTGM